jgi:hypothetical protein
VPPDVLPLPCWTCPSLPLKLEVYPCSQGLPDPMWSVRPPCRASLCCPRRLYGCVGQRLRFVSSRGVWWGVGPQGGGVQTSSARPSPKVFFPSLGHLPGRGGSTAAQRDLPYGRSRPAVHVAGQHLRSPGEYQRYLGYPGPLLAQTGAVPRRPVGALKGTPYRGDRRG